MVGRRTIDRALVVSQRRAESVAHSGRRRWQTDRPDGTAHCRRRTRPRDGRVVRIGTPRLLDPSAERRHLAVAGRPGRKSSPRSVSGDRQHALEQPRIVVAGRDADRFQFGSWRGDESLALVERKNSPTHAWRWRRLSAELVSRLRGTGFLLRARRLSGHLEVEFEDGGTDPTDTRRGAEHQSILLAGRTPYCVPIRPRRPSRSVGDEFGWFRATTADHGRSHRTFPAMGTRRPADLFSLPDRRKGSYDDRRP